MLAYIYGNVFDEAFLLTENGFVQWRQNITNFYIMSEISKDAE